MKRLMLPFAVPLLVSGCQWVHGPRQAVAAASPVDSHTHCTAHEVSRERLIVEGNRALYVEPVVLTTSRKGDVLLAGTPNYLTVLNQSGRGVGFVHDSVFGVLLRPDGRKHIVSAPMDARRIGAIRAVELGDGKWAFTFAERDRPRRADESPSDEIDPTPVIRLWYGVYDGRIWSSLEQLPFPSEGRVKPFNSSLLVRQGDTLAWAMQLDVSDDRDKAVLFERLRGRWKYEIVPASNAVYVTLAHSDTLGFLIAAVHGDLALRTDENSLFLYGRVPAWKPLRRVVHGGEEGPVDFPSLSLSATADILSWTASVRESGHGRQEGRAMLGPLEERNTHVIVLDSSIAWSFIPVPMRNGTHLWVADHVLSTGKSDREIRIITDSAAVKASIIGRIPNPYLGFFNATSSGPSEVLVAGSFGDSTTGVLHSLLLRAHVDCDAKTL